MTMDALLDIRNFSMEYETGRGAVRALHDVSFSIAAGEIVGVVGESGCGKSSLVGAILRLSPGNARTRGEIFFKHRDLQQMDGREMRELRGSAVSAVFQDPMRTHNPVMTVGAQMTDIQHRENISRSEKLKRAETMLSRVGISDPGERLQQYPHQLSGGMLQRIAIGMALMSRPDLIIADEPTTALDATMEMRTIEMLRDLQRDYGCAVLFVSHHLGVIAELCEKVAVMYAGEVAEFGEVDDVFNRPSHPYTRRLLECDPGRAQRTSRGLPTIPGAVPDLSAPSLGCAFAPRCDSAKSKCTSHRPPTFEDGGQRVACWLYETES